MKQNPTKSRAKSPLRRMRMRQGLLQGELSRLSGVTQCAISRMERNGVKRADKAIALAKALHCNIEDILEF